MNYLDIILLLVLLIFFFLGIKRGFFLSFLQLLGILLVIVLVRQFGVLISNGIHQRLGISETWALVIGYSAIFIIIMLLAKGISNLLQSILELISLGWLDRFLGGIFNILFGSAIIIILIMILEASSLANSLGESRDRSFMYSSARIIARDIIEKYVDGIPGSRPSRERYQRYRPSRPV